MTSTGSPLAAESFDFVYERIKRDIHLASISGGTDIVSCFVGGNPIGPVWRGEIQARSLGMKVEVFDEQGRPVTGEKGELVCTMPFPSMPIGFWNDPDGSSYHAAYFDVYPGVWRHGDWVEITEHGGVIIYGRSDAVLNPGGVRIGTAEIYRQVEQLDEILESVVIGQQWENDERIVLFVKLRDGVRLDDALGDRIRRRIRENTTPRHVPARSCRSHRRAADEERQDRRAGGARRRPRPRRSRTARRSRIPKRWTNTGVDPELIMTQRCDSLRLPNADRLVRRRAEGPFGRRSRRHRHSRGDRPRRHQCRRHR